MGDWRVWIRQSCVCGYRRECRCNLESLYKLVGWPLYKKYGHAFDAFGAAMADPEKVLGPLGLEEDIKEKLITTIQHRHKVWPGSLPPGLASQPQGRDMEPSRTPGQGVTRGFVLTIGVFSATQSIPAKSREPFRGVGG